MRSAERDDFSIAPDLEGLSPLLDVEDGRRWSPDVDPEPRSVTGNRTWNVIPFTDIPIVSRPRYRVHRRSIIARDYYTGFPVGVQVPVGIKRTGVFPVAMCVRRKIRRAVMFAKRKTGLGAKAKRRRRNSYTGVKC